MKRRRRLLVLCPHPEHVAPGQRLKYEQYFDHFRANGIDVVVSPFMSLRMWNIVYAKGRLAEKVLWTLWGYLRRVFDLLRLRSFDGAYVFLWVTPFGPPLFESLACRLARSVVYDIDDLVFLAPPSRANRLIAPLKGRKKMEYLMRHAQQVIVCTPALEEVARRHNASVTDISSTINTDTYRPTGRYEGGRRLTIGWSGSHSTSKYLTLLEPVFAKLRIEHEFDVLVIGDPSFRFEREACEAIPWREATEVADLQRIDIGVYPLPDEPWVYGKSGLKALQYMALGIPTVATAIGANFRVIEDGVSGFLVRTEEEWVDRLRLLLTDAGTRARVGAGARERVERLYSVRANRDRYLSIVQRAIGAGDGRSPVGASEAARAASTGSLS